MDGIFVAAGILGGIGVVGVLVQAAGEARRRKKRFAADLAQNDMHFACRKAAREAEALAVLNAEAAYRKSINDAFEDARETGTLIVNEVSCEDIQIDRYKVGDRKTLLTRITPILTQKLAEMIREFEIEDAREGGVLAYINRAAQDLKWRVEEVPVRFEPPGLKDADRIFYPDTTLSHFELPDSLKYEARRMLGYDDDYIAQEVKARNERESSFEVTE